LFVVGIFLVASRFFFFVLPASHAARLHDGLHLGIAESSAYDTSKRLLWERAREAPEQTKALSRALLPPLPRNERMGVFDETVLFLPKFGCVHMKGSSVNQAHESAASRDEGGEKKGGRASARERERGARTRPSFFFGARKAASGRRVAFARE
jgi:hypothetical protein